MITDHSHDDIGPLGQDLIQHMLEEHDWHSTGHDVLAQAGNVFDLAAAMDHESAHA